MKKEKLILQVIICLGIFALLRSSNLPGGETLENIRETINHNLEKHYTLQDIKEMSEGAAETIVSIPASVSQAVIEANEKGQYGEPLDAESSEGVKPVHAVAGGKILKSGISRQLGMYVTIEHPDKISTYGKLCNLTMVSGERVKKGDIIGSYDTEGGEEFYYTLEEKT